MENSIGLGFARSRQTNKQNLFLYFISFDLCRAVKNRNLEIVQMLIEKKAKLSAADKSGKQIWQTYELTWFSFGVIRTLITALTLLGNKKENPTIYVRQIYHYLKNL